MGAAVFTGVGDEVGLDDGVGLSAGVGDGEGERFGPLKRTKAPINNKITIRGKMWIIPFCR